MKIETKLVHGSKGYDECTGSISFPIYQSATFRHPGPNQSTGYDYSRLQNPTSEELENTLARLENGSDGFAFASGMAAIATVLELFKSGQHVIVSDDLYGGTYRLFEEISKGHGLDFTYIDTTDVNKIKKAIQPNTKGIFLETPSNPMMKVADIKEIVTLVKPLGIITIVDNTFLTPYFQRPLDLGADIVVHSTTKYLGGHSDVIGGAVITSDPLLHTKIKNYQGAAGAIPAPWDSWLILRGLKTLKIRMKEHEASALHLASFLEQHPAVEQVFYPGLTSHPQHELAKQQMSGFGGMLTFALKGGLPAVEKLIARIKLFVLADSLGGVESLIASPAKMTLGALSEEERRRRKCNDNLVRISIGLENAGDLEADLRNALEEC